MTDSIADPRPDGPARVRVLWGRAPLEKPAVLRYTHLENVVLHVADLDGFTAVAILL